MVNVMGAKEVTVQATTTMLLCYALGSGRYCQGREFGLGLGFGGRVRLWASSYTKLCCSQWKLILSERFFFLSVCWRLAK